MIEAYILVQTEVGRAQMVADTVRKISGINSAEVVSGPYDLIIRAQGADESSIRAAILPGVQKAEYVTRTLTCPVVESTSHFIREKERF